MKKVVHIINIDIGIRIHLRRQLLFLREEGYDVSAICSPGPLIPTSEVGPDGIAIHTIYMSRNINLFQDLRSLLRLFVYLHEKRFDIVHTHSVKPGLYGRIAARLAGVPCIIHTVHGLLIYEGMPRHREVMWRISEKLGAMFGHYILSQSWQDMEILIQKRVCKAEKIGYLGNGIDLNEFNPNKIPLEQIMDIRKKLGVNDDNKIIAIVGRLLAEKGHLEFAEMARLVHKKHPKTQFWIIGRIEKDKSGSLVPEDVITSEMESYAQFLGLRTDMPLIFAAMDIFVFPSHHEGMPRSLMEAAAMAKPIVATDIRGCREAIQPNVTGILVPTQDAEALATAVNHLLEDEILAARLGTSARSYALEHFDEQAYLLRLIETYTQLLERPQG